MMKNTIRGGLNVVLITNHYYLLIETPEANLNWIKKTFLSSRKEEKEIPQLKELKPKLTPKAVVLEVCKKFAIDKEAVIKKE